jgi:hypothetical protein
MQPTLVAILYRALAVVVVMLVSVDASGRALTHQLPLPAALGYGAGIVVLILYAAGACEPVADGGLSRTREDSRDL